MHFKSIIVTTVTSLQLCQALPWPIDLLQLPLGQSTRPGGKEVIAALKGAAVIPDVLDDFTPSFDLILTYSSKHQVVQLGNKIKPSAVQSAPNVEIFARPSTLAPTRTLSSNVSYTLALTDPDATSRVDPKMGEMCHWLVTGIRLPAESHEFHAKPAVGSTRGHVHFQGENLDGEATEELMPYKPPAPPPKTGYHRYVFVLLAPASEDASKELKKPKDRPHWGYGKIGKGVRDWAEDNDLVPVGANFFWAKNKKQ